jgi:hypothetical protein
MQGVFTRNGLNSVSGVVSKERDSNSVIILARELLSIVLSREYGQLHRLSGNQNGDSELHQNTVKFGGDTAALSRLDHEV